MNAAVNLLKSESGRVVLGFVVLIGAFGLLRTGTLPGVAETFVEALGNTGPNQMERDSITKNYYEELNDVDRDPEWNFGEGWLRPTVQKVMGIKRGGGEEKKQNWQSIAIYGATVDQPTGFIEHRLKPGWIGVHKGVDIHINKWGHRDEGNYEKEKPAGTFRIALCGSSNSFGSGVPRESVFEYIVEKRLNETLAGQGYEHYEIINFSVPRYHLLERAYIAENDTPEFHPDLILVAVTMRDLREAMFESVIRRVREGRDLHYPFLREIVKNAEVKQTDSESRIKQLLGSYTTELAAAVLHDLKEFSDESGIPVAMLIMRLEVEGVDENLKKTSTMAAFAGVAVIELFDAYTGQKAKEMYLIPNQDYHPTIAGHARLADELYDDLIKEPFKSLLTGPTDPAKEPTDGN